MKTLSLSGWILLWGLGAASAAQESQVDHRQSPSENARWITLIVQAPKGVDPLPVSLHYRSSQCKTMRAYGVGGMSESGTTLMATDSHSAMGWSRSDPQSGEYQMRVAIDAGGPCLWALRKLTLPFTYRSANPMVKGQKVHADSLEFEFGEGKGLFVKRKLNVRMKFDYVPVIFQNASGSESTLKLMPKIALPFIPEFNPLESGILAVHLRVFESLELKARQDSTDKSLYRVSYPDGFTALKPASFMREDDARVQCLMETGKPQCSQWPKEADY